MKALGKHHPRLKEIARLHDASGRREAGQFLVEGVRALEDLADSDFSLRELLVGEELGGRAARVAERLAARGAELLTVEARVLERLTPGETSQGLLGVAEIPDLPLEAVLTGNSLLICDGLADPGNLGTLIRTARATGTGGVLVLGGTDPYGPKAVRAAAGAFFQVPLRVGVPADLDSLEAAGFTPVATVVSGGTDLFRADLPAKPAWWLGSEAHGLSPESARRAPLCISLPMQGGESLNVAICGSVMMFEWVRRSQLRA